MMTNTMRTIASAAALCLGCNTSPHINVGHEIDAGHSGGGGGSGGTSGSSGLGGMGGGNALTAHIEDPQAMTIDVVTLNCTGDCADVIAVASGGNGPYTFVWNDGVTTAARELCAIDTTAFSVIVADTPIDDDEFHYPGQTAVAPITAHVIDCPTDGGVPALAPCIVNPSFEGVPGSSIDAPPWESCYSSPDLINDTHPGPFPFGYAQTPTDGDTALGLWAGLGGQSESVGQALCAPLRAGELAYVMVDVANPVIGSEIRVEIHGSNSNPCGLSALLGESDPIPFIGTGQWTQRCITLRPEVDTPFMRMQLNVGRDQLMQGYWVIDNLVRVESCS